MEVRLLGDFRVIDGGVEITPRGTKQRVLLAVLALRWGEVVAVEQLAEILWGDDPPAHPANAIQAQVSALRKVLPEGTVLTRGGGYTLGVDRSAVDSWHFEQSLAAGRSLLAEGRPYDASRRLREALACWRGPALADFVFDDFAQPEITRLDEERLDALELRVEADLDLGEHAAVLAELEELCTRHPWRERFWVQRMVALYRCGRQADALRAYADVRERLAAELGLEPGPELRRAEAMVLAHDAALVAPSRSPHARTGNLRARLTRFIGRDDETRRIVDGTRQHRLVTLVGPGGAGKTRLAMEVGDAVAGEYGDGVWFVDLAPVSAPQAVAPAVAAALAELDPAGGPADDAAARTLDQLAALLAGRRAMVLMDNCEHVADETAVVAHELLTRVPGLRMIATSREALGVPGERLVAVPPLDRAAAVDLFLDRASAAGRTIDGPEALATVDEICQRLDGLPLAIELAAARTRALTVAQIAVRLDDRFRLLTGGTRTALPRQQTLRAVVDWSHDLLFEDERRLFARLSVFANACTLEAVEEICADDLLPAADIVEVLGRLVDKSLVVHDVDGDGHDTYRMLQTLRVYAHERLADSGEADAVGARHAAWFLHEARAAGRGLMGPDGSAWRRRIAAEIDDLRNALDWFVGHDQADPAATLTIGLAWGWFLRAEWHEAVRWIDDALQVPGQVPGRPTAHQALARQWRAYFTAFFDPGEACARDARDAFELVCATGSPAQRARAGMLLASTLNRMSCHREALGIIDGTRADLYATDDAWSIAVCDVIAATAHMRLGELDQAESAATDGVVRLRRLGDESVVIEPMGHLSQLAALRGDLTGALAGYGELVDISRRRELPGYLAYWLIARGAVLLRLGDAESARTDFAEAVELSQNPVNTAAALVGRARAAARLGEPAAGLPLLERAVTLLTGAGQEAGVAATTVAIGLTHLQLGDIDRATALAAEVGARDPVTGSILGAAIAAARGDSVEFDRLHSAWDPAAAQATGGSLAALLAADHALLGAPAAAR